MTINAADVLDTNAVTIGTHQIDLVVIGDTAGGSANNRDVVDLNGFTALTGAGNTNLSYSDPITGLSHTYDIYQGTGANTGIKIAIEHDLNVV